MRLYRDAAVVVRQHKFGDADWMVLLLARADGWVSAVAHAVWSTCSKFGPAETAAGAGLPG
ncbi:hypothetical protein FVP46_00015, partial [Mycobacterium tuberculosis]|nr:hypothetical protein [Mycobacterium tuberculosis]